MNKNERFYKQFFRGALTHLRIRILRSPGVESAEETEKQTLSKSKAQILHCIYGMRQLHGFVCRYDTGHLQ